MGKKKNRKQSALNEIIYINGIGFRLENEVMGFHCTHFLYRSVNGGYLLSFTNIDVELGDVESKKGRKKCVRPLI